MISNVTDTSRQNEIDSAHRERSGAVASGRLAHLVVAAGLAATLAFAWILTPDPR